MQNLKVLSETLLDNYRITIDMKKECTRVLLGLASPLDTANRNGNRLPQNVERLGAYIARSCLEGKISPKTKLHILHQE